MRQRTVLEPRNRSSNPSTPSDWCLSCAKYTYEYGRCIAIAYAHAAHVQPLVTAFALHHGLAVVDAVTYAACTFAARETASVGRWSVGSGGRGKGVGEGVVVAVAVG